MLVLAVAGWEGFGSDDSLAREAEGADSTAVGQEPLGGVTSDNPLKAEDFAPDFDSTEVPVVHPAEPAAASAPPPTRVGSRRFPNLYSGCSSSELLASLSKATIRPDGMSRLNYTQPAGYEIDELPLPKFEFGYDLPGCPAPHVFTPAETCDLLTAFGGLYVVGDSLMRQFTQG